MPDTRNADEIDPAERLHAPPGKYMTFKVGDEAYGVEIVKVREIIRLMEITRLPNAGECIRGVINLRGKVIPVLDLRLKFGTPESASTEQAVIIVLQCVVAGRSLTLGILVEQVLEVLSIEASQIEPPPSFGRASGEDFILGIGKTPGGVLILLDIDGLLAEHDEQGPPSAAA